MVAGELVAEGTPTEIKSTQEGHLLEFNIDQPQRASDFLKQSLDRSRVSLLGDRLHVITDEETEPGIRNTTRQLSNYGIGVMAAKEVRFSLEDVFIELSRRRGSKGKWHWRIRES
jgi:ABC-2 type transport system ATP-binding protein